MKNMILIFVTIGALIGCSSTQKSTADSASAQYQDVKNTTFNTGTKTNSISDITKNSNFRPTIPTGSHLEFPTNVQPGQCFAKVRVPASYKFENKKVMVAPESLMIQTVPGKFQMVDKKILVQEASQKLNVIPATYKTVQEKILVAEAKTIIKTVPTTYKTVKEKILVKPAR